MTPNPSIERTASSRLRLPPAAAHVKRWARRWTNSPAVTHDPGLSTAYENSRAIFSRVSKVRKSQIIMARFVSTGKEY